jgi:hypothetical protein
MLLEYGMNFITFCLLTEDITLKLRVWTGFIWLRIETSGGLL